ncbi:MAG: polymerase, sigma-24 subunit, subfamily [Verrucomicrobiales bacterium]|nr:polymerase, sigma-24 subunit, subfamily [Verrucomicrobiales bacterium]
MKSATSNCSNRVFIDNIANPDVPLNMNAGKLRMWPVAMLLVAAVIIIFLQQQQTTRLAAENDKLRVGTEEALKLRQENGRLAAELSAVQKRAEAQVQELARLRGKATASSQTEQQNLKLKTELERLAQQQPASVAGGEAEPVEVREKKHLMAKMSFGKNLALSLITFADAHDGKLPEDALSATASLDSSPDSAQFGFKTDDYDFLLKGLLYAVKEPGSTILAKEKKSVQLMDGRFGRTYIFADGHVELVRRNAPGEFAAWEQEHMEQKEQP